MGTLVKSQTLESFGIRRVHRYPLVELKCVSPKRRKEMAAGCLTLDF
jgi:hypothetical protein